MYIHIVPRIQYVHLFVYKYNILFIIYVGAYVMTIRKVKGPRGGTQYQLVSKSGKVLGKGYTRAAMEKREKQVNYFKHKNK